MALAWLIRNSIAHARTSAIAEINTRSLEVDPLYRFAATTFRGVLSVEIALAPLVTSTNQGLIPLDLKDMTPFHRFVALTISWTGA